MSLESSEVIKNLDRTYFSSVFIRYSHFDILISNNFSNFKRTYFVLIATLILTLSKVKRNYTKIDGLIQLNFFFCNIYISYVT